MTMDSTGSSARNEEDLAGSWISSRTAGRRLPSAWRITSTSGPAVRGSGRLKPAPTTGVRHRSYEGATLRACEEIAIDSSGTDCGRAECPVEVADADRLTAREGSGTARTHGVRAARGPLGPRSTVRPPEPGLGPAAVGAAADAISSQALQVARGTRKTTLAMKLRM
jgi:hypothetical protein